jgi:hypothetical protein
MAILFPVQVLITRLNLWEIEKLNVCHIFVRIFSSALKSYILFEMFSGKQRFLEYAVFIVTFLSVLFINNSYI